ncbi:hypothetical protein DFH06DRAFT_1153334 [Mycena polygramma]|nr:hypothetical protein DFH06DRAFT_1153334 [Mycena polygramma]
MNILIDRSQNRSRTGAEKVEPAPENKFVSIKRLGQVYRQAIAGWHVRELRQSFCSAPPGMRSMRRQESGINLQPSSTAVDCLYGGTARQYRRTQEGDRGMQWERIFQGARGSFFPFAGQADSGTSEAELSVHCDERELREGHSFCLRPSSPPEVAQEIDPDGSTRRDAQNLYVSKPRAVGAGMWFAGTVVDGALHAVKRAAS